MIKYILGVVFLSISLSGCQGLTKKGESTTESETEITQANSTAPEIINENLGGSDTDAESPIDNVPAVTNQSSPQDVQAENDAETQHKVAVTPPEPKAPVDIWERIRAGYKLNLDVDQPRLRSQLRWYSSHPNYLTRVSKRGERYLYFIVEELEKANMPLEIALLPIVESGFDPFGYSHGRASGPWQFIPSTGQIYGLDQNWWYDGRRDITLSTKAAIAYLTKLGRMFDGNWLHALASYNSGEGTVMRAIRKNKKAGKPTDFWSLDLPKETRAYVPKLLALAKIIKDPAKYSYTTHFIVNKPYFEQVNIGGQIDLAQAANMADISIDEIYLLNPAFNQWATAPNGPHKLLVPISKAKNFRTKLASISPKDRVTWVRYTVKAGDNLLGVAKSHNTTVDVLQDVNKISSSLIRVGQQLMIPVAGNKIESYTLSSHQRLLTKQSTSPSRSRIKLNYTVQAGDSLWKIAKQYNTSSKTLARWNSMGLGDPLRPGKKLVVWVKSDKATNTNGRKSIIKKVVYTLRSGDSLARVANKFNVSLSNIRKWNPNVSKKKYVQPGDKVTLLVNVVGG
ncbi:LysM peptidoglycan-binding domain-containing protein [Marinomonas balearica]|uniref:Membrane-bound lytic murein transglycosylase D n=1 Tax=Marinomonas balearica TaxID=491947 RepID=A0A4R6MCK4_9GAMM|nr:LysM peptidoglycan-binding domain-containing protein [Marinomonas balearica]TDO98895.1 membrane-bound lytic murein transglycosylase D [Marinomonas balearica]